LARYTPSLAVDSNGLRYYVSTGDLHIGRSLFMNGAFEGRQLETAAELIAELTATPHGLCGAQFIDVGANIGTASLHALAHLGASYAWAFEPAPEPYRLLLCNIVANQMEGRVIPINVGLSDHPGDGLLELSSTNWGDNRVRMASTQPDGSYGESARPVTRILLDSFDNSAASHGIDLDDVGLVWVDAQGHEALILQGASTLTCSAIPVVLEYWPYGQERAGTLSLLHDIISSTYRRVVDLTESIRQGVPCIVASHELASLSRRYDGTKHTDLILLK